MEGLDELDDCPDQIALLGGTVHPEFEILDCQAEVDLWDSTGAVLIVPIGWAIQLTDDGIGIGR